MEGTPIRRGGVDLIRSTNSSWRGGAVPGGTEITGMSRCPGFGFMFGLGMSVFLEVCALALSLFVGNDVTHNLVIVLLLQVAVVLRFDIAGNIVIVLAGRIVKGWLFAQIESVGMQPLTVRKTSPNLCPTDALDTTTQHILTSWC